MIQRGDVQTHPTHCIKRWQPDGLIGFTKSVMTGYIRGSVDPYCISEHVYLGFIAIEHKKSEKDQSDM